MYTRARAHTHTHTQQRQRVIDRDRQTRLQTEKRMSGKRVTEEKGKDRERDAVIHGHIQIETDSRETNKKTDRQSDRRGDSHSLCLSVCVLGCSVEHRVADRFRSRTLVLPEVCIAGFDSWRRPTSWTLVVWDVGLLQRGESSAAQDMMHVFCLFVFGQIEELKQQLHVADTAEKSLRKLILHPNLGVPPFKVCISRLLTDWSLLYFSTWDLFSNVFVSEWLMGGQKVLNLVQYSVRLEKWAANPWGHRLF